MNDYSSMQLTHGCYQFIIMQTFFLFIDSKRSPLTITTAATSTVPVQPPNSPNSGNTAVGSNPNRNLVDLTEGASNVSSSQNKVR